MGINLAALFYFTVAFLAAAPLLPRGLQIIERARILAVYAFCAYLLLFLAEDWEILIIGGAFMALMAPTLMAQRTVYFFAIVPALPSYLNFHVSLPGVNYLVSLTSIGVAVLFVLIPAAFSKQPPNVGTQPRFAESNPPALLWRFIFSAPAIVIAFSLYWGQVHGDALNVTAGVRKFVQLLLGFALPYILIVYTLRSQEAIDNSIRAIVAGAAILSTYVAVATVLQWDIYRIREVPVFGELQDFRGGFLRMQATANTHSLSYYAACAIVLVAWLRHHGDYSWLAALILQSLLLLTILFTGSRSGLMCLGVAIATYLYMMSDRKFIKPAFLVTVIAGVIYQSSRPISSIDTHGTVEYRRQLVIAALEHISENPFFGNFAYLNSGKWEHLRWGGGLVDITNLYLLRALELGLVGLFLYFYIFVKAMVLPLKSSDSRKCMRLAVLKCLMFGWLMLVVTTSDVGLTEYIGVILAALCVAQRNVTIASARVAGKVEPVPPLIRSGPALAA